MFIQDSSPWSASSSGNTAKVRLCRMLKDGRVDMPGPPASPLCSGVVKRAVLATIINGTCRPTRAKQMHYVPHTVCVCVCVNRGLSICATSGPVTADRPPQPSHPGRHKLWPTTAASGRARAATAGTKPSMLCHLHSATTPSPYTEPARRAAI